MGAAHQVMPLRVVLVVVVDAALSMHLGLLILDSGPAAPQDTQQQGTLQIPIPDLATLGVDQTIQMH